MGGDILFEVPKKEYACLVVRQGEGDASLCRRFDVVLDVGLSFKSCVDVLISISG